MQTVKQSHVSKYASTYERNDGVKLTIVVQFISICWLPDDVACELKNISRNNAEHVIVRFEYFGTTMINEKPYSRKNLQHLNSGNACWNSPPKLLGYPVPWLKSKLNPLNRELNPICYLLALLAHHFLHVSKIRVKSLTLTLLMSYIYGAHILDVSRSHTTTQHSR